MSSEDGHDEHAAQPVQRFLGADPDSAHLRQRSGERTTLAPGLATEPQSDAAALAMVGLGKIDELEVESKGSRE